MAVAGYKVRINGGEFTNHIVDVGLPAPGVGGILSHLFQSLEAETEYAVEVAAYDGAGNQSDWSEPVSQETLAWTLWEIPAAEFELIDGGGVRNLDGGQEILYIAPRLTNEGDFVEIIVPDHVASSTVLRASSVSNSHYVQINQNGNFKNDTESENELLGDFFQSGDVLKFERVAGNRLKYYRNGALKRYSTTVLTGAWRLSFDWQFALENDEILSPTTNTHTDASNPTAPGSFAAEAAFSTVINLSWTTSTDNNMVTFYEIHRAKNSGFSSELVIRTIGKKTEFKDTGLEPHTQYYYKIRARDGRGNYSGFSSTVNDTTPDAERENFALAGTATATSEYDADIYSAMRAINGHRTPNGHLGEDVDIEDGGIWRSASTPTPFGAQVLTVDLGGVKTIDEINVFTSRDDGGDTTEPALTETFIYYGIQFFTVEYHDGADWILLKTIVGNNKVWKRITFEPLEAEQVRVSVTQSAAGYAEIVEVEVWGDGEDGGGGGSIELVDSAIAGSSNQQDVGVSLNSTGANLVVVAVSHYGGGGAAPFTDSLSNTWIPLTEFSEGTPYGQLFYCLNPTVGVGHTFDINTALTIYPTIGVIAFSGIDSFDRQSGSTANAQTIQPGSLTPPSDNALIVTVLASQTNGADSIGSGFTLEGVVGNDSNHISLAMAYKIQSSVGAENPTWATNLGYNQSVVALMASFEAT